jgi:hypothetical protein
MILDLGQLDSRGVDLWGMPLQNRGQPHFSIKKQKRNGSESVGSVLWHICEVGTIMYDISIINVRFYLLEVPYPHEYCRITLKNNKYSIISCNTYLLIIYYGTLGQLDSRGVDLWGMTLQNRGQPHFSIKKQKRNGSESVGSVLWHICEVGTIMYDISIINVRFYLLEVPYPHEYCRIILKNNKYSILSCNTYLLIIY